MLTLLDTSELLLADEEAMEVTTSTEALISASDDPDEEDTWIPLFQTESIALRISRSLN